MRRSLSICLLLIFIVSSGEAVEVEILYTGETHAALDPCDCPVEPDGGILRRATVLRDERRAHPHLVLLDAGGAFAGGMYDEATQGHRRDRQRTDFYLKAMRLMGYDAMVAGDEEFRYGADYLLQQSFRLPIVSANALLTDAASSSAEGASRLLPSHVIVETQGVRIAVIGVTTPEAARLALADVAFADPASAVERAIAATQEQADIIAVLSHLGEEESRQLVEQVQGIDILINGHRKRSPRPFEILGDTLWLQFSYQGRKLGKLIFDFDEGQIQDPRFEFIPLNSTIPDDPELAALLREYRSGEAASTTPETLRLDLYVMGLCPYAATAEDAVAEVVRRFGDQLDWRVYFIVEEREGELASLRGAEELEEDAVQAAIARYYPDRLWDYLRWRHSAVRGTSWRTGARQFGFHQARLEMFQKSGQARQILREHAWRVARLGVTDSPTIFINNQRYTGPLRADALTRALCAKAANADRWSPCQSLPECVVDQDCQKDGFIGVCEGAGTDAARCKHIKAVNVPLTVVRDPTAYLSNEEDIVSSTRTLFPGVEVRTIDSNTSEGKRWVEQYGLRRLPAYLFGPEVLEARHLERVKPNLRLTGDLYMASPASVGAPLWVGRPREPHRLDLFVQPLSPEALRAWVALHQALEGSPWRIQLHYLLEYPMAREEAARQRVIRAIHPERFLPYLEARIEMLDSSYWEEGLLAVGLDPIAIKRLAKEQERELLREDRAWAREMQLSGEVALVVENREAVPLQSARQLRVLIERITGIDIHPFDRGPQQAGR